LDETERKKATKKAKKAARKAGEQAAQQAAVETKDPSAKKDDDPNGEQLVKTDKPLDDALKFLKPLQELSPTLLETQLLAFDVHFRRGRFFFCGWG
jgi:N-alpha-acetyltransferase 15/16, NatA auxiliary subunit